MKEAQIEMRNKEWDFKEYKDEVTQTMLERQKEMGKLEVECNHLKKTIREYQDNYIKAREELE